MKFDRLSSHRYEKEFFGRAYPWFRSFLLSIIGISLIGNLSAFYMGLTDRIDFVAMGLIVLMAILIAICLRLLYLGIMKFLSINWNKIADFFKDIILGMFAICILLVFGYIMFHDCSGRSQSDIEHVHYEKYHQ